MSTERPISPNAGWPQRPLRVLAIGHSYTVGMNRAIVREVALDPSFDVTVAAPRRFQGDLRPVECTIEPGDSRIRIVPLRGSNARNLHLFRYDQADLRRLFAQHEFDVVHAWEEPYIYAGYQIASALKNVEARFCFRTAQNLVKYYPPPSSFFERAVLRRAQGWLAGGGLVYKAMLSRGYPADRGRIITLAVDATLFTPATDSERDEAKRALGLEGPVICYIGRLAEEKGLDVLMAALQRLPVGRPWSLLLLGSGPYASRVTRWAESRGWAGRVRIHLAKHEEMPRTLHAADIMVAPSQTTRRWREQFGRMIIEAFAAGVPVIASDSGEIPFVVGDAGRIVPERDAAAYATAIGEILWDDVLHAEMSAKGRARVALFSVKTVAGQFRDFYRWLAEQPR